MRRWAAVGGVLLLGSALGGMAAGCDGSTDPGPPPAEQVITSAPTATPLADSDWPTYHRDNARTGVAVNFPTPTRLAVAWRARLDGAVYGQPLMLGGMVFAATENDTVYALDGQTGAVRWQRHLGTPMRKRQLPCGNIDPLGITSTMAYDPATGLLFALAESAGARHTLYGLDRATGEVRVSRAAEPPKGDRVAHQQRSALTVLNGKVYIAYGGLAGDCAQYIGSVVALPTVGNGPAVSYAVPTTREAGIWSPAGGTVHNGRLLYAVGNGESTQGSYDGSDSVLALSPDLKLVDRYSPDTWAEDNAADLDLGSMSPVVVGGFVFVAGKRGIGYTLRPDRLGGIGGEVAQAEVCAGFGGSAVDGDTVYVPCSDGTRAVTIDASGGIKVRWHTDVPAAGSPVLGGGAVWVVDYSGGVLYLLDPATGAVRQQLTVGTMPHFTSPTLAGGLAYLGTMTGVTAARPG